jgi:hypothetical protein
MYFALMPPHDVLRAFTVHSKVHTCCYLIDVALANLVIVRRRYIKYSILFYSKFPAVSAIWFTLINSLLCQLIGTLSEILKHQEPWTEPQVKLSLLRSNSLEFQPLNSEYSLESSYWFHLFF